MKSNSERSIRGSDVILLLRLIPLSVLLLNLLHSPLAAFGRSGSMIPFYADKVANSTAANPLIYTRLRFDSNYLQIYRNYQLPRTLEEKEVELRVNETSLDDPGGETREVVYTYYENKQIDANLITRDDLILEALDRTYKTRLIPAFLYNYDNPEDREKASDPRLISEPKCRRHLAYLKTKLDNKVSDPINPELAAFFDSYASEEPGLLLGNYHWTGTWRQCYKRQIFDKTTSEGVTNFRGRYCIASIRSRQWEPKIKHKVKHALDSGVFYKYPEQRYDHARFFRIQVGICLPESCDSRTIDTQRELIRQLTVHKLREPLRSYDLVDLFCLPDETGELRKLSTSAWCLILLAIGWCSAIVWATLCDLKRKQQHTETGSKSVKTKSCLDKLVSALSLWRNYHRLTETSSLAPPQPPPTATTHDGSNNQVTKPVESRNALAPNDLLFLNAFKMISMPGILFGHTGMLGIMLNRFPLDYEALEYDTLNHFNISTVFFVDWFFMITGFLGSYLAFVTKKVERNSLGQWIYTIFHRYWRLAPIYILLFWFCKTLFKHTGSGPVWDYGTNNMTLRSKCQQESWLWPIALASNFHPVHDECIMPAWYLANDMQFYIITPFILIAMSKRPKWAWLATAALLGSSVLGRFIFYLTDPRALPLDLMRPRYDAYMRTSWDTHSTYIYPQYRIPSYLIGLLAGSYTYMVLSGRWRSPLYKHQQATTSPNGDSWADRRRWFLRAFVFLAGLTMVVSMNFASGIISGLFPRSLEPHVRYFTAMIYASAHTTAALGLALMSVALMLGQFVPIRRFLSHPAFTLISRINFFVFIAQVEIIYWLLQSTERLVDLSARDAFKYWILLSAICYPLAALCTLWLELPLANLEREFIGSWMAGRGGQSQIGPKAATGAESPSKSTSDRKRRNNKMKTDDSELASLAINSQIGGANGQQRKKKADSPVEKQRQQVSGGEKEQRNGTGLVRRRPTNN